MSTLKKAKVAAIAGILLWFCLSPRVATRLYNEILMTRTRNVKSLEVSPPERLVQPISFKTTNGQELHGLLYTLSSEAGEMSANSQSATIMLYFGGRLSNLSKSKVPATGMLRAGANAVLAFEYRGFGDTAGRASTKSILEDGLAAYDALINLGYSSENIVLYGESLGASVATHVAEHRPSAGLILQSGFSSLERQAKELVPVMRLYPTAMFPHPRLASEATIGRRRVPVLILHGTDDRVIHHEHAKRLARAAGAQSRLVSLPGAGHSGVHVREDWQQAVHEFISSLQTKA